MCFSYVYFAILFSFIVLILVALCAIHVSSCICHFYKICNFKLELIKNNPETAQITPTLDPQESSKVKKKSYHWKTHIQYDSIFCVGTNKR